MANTKKMMALRSISEAAGLAVACAEAEDQTAHKHEAASTKSPCPMPSAKTSADMTWAEPKFRDTFESVAPVSATSPKYVLKSTFAQWLTSRAGYKTT